MMCSLASYLKDGAMQPDLAVLCCLPLSEQDWHERLAQRQCGDFVRMTVEKKFAGNAQAAWSVFAREAEFIERKLSSFSQRGLSVTRRATASDIAQAALGHRDVVVLAHWKGDTALASDHDLPDNRLETWDAMLSAEELSQLLPADFNGTIYLAVCTSHILTEVVRRQHPAAMCICSVGTVMAGLALAKLDAAIKLMATRKIPLWRGLLEAGQLIDTVA